MIITKKHLTQGKVELNITITPNKYEKYLRSTALELGEKIMVPGFRPGKAPYYIIKNQIGEMQILQESLNKIIAKTYAQAIKQEKLRPAMSPKIDVLKMAPGNPIEYKAEIVVLPNVVLPKFSKIKIKRREINVKQEQEFKEKQRQEMEMLEHLIEHAKFDKIASELLEDARDEMLDDVKFIIQRQEIKWEDYLKKIKKTEQDLKMEFASQSEKQIKIDAIIAQVVDQENLEVKAKEVEDEMNRFLQQFGSINKVKKQINLLRLRASVKGRLLNRKAVEFLKSKIIVN